jgi:hypothetical protein
MSPSRVVLAALLAIALALAGAVAVTPSASANTQPRTFTVFLSFGKGEFVKTGAKKGVGDLGVFTGGVSESFGGARSGTYTVVTRVVSRTGSGANAIDTRDTRLQIRLAGGTVLAQAFVDDPSQRPLTGTHIMPVIGGTGTYKTARGTVILRPVGRTGTYALAFDVFIDSRTPQTKTSVSALSVTSFTGPTGDGIGASELAAGQTGPRSVVSVGTVVQRNKSAVTLDSDVLITLPGGTVIARDVVAARRGKAVTARYAVIGGTGDYAGRRGEVRLVPQASQTRIELSLTARPGGRATSERWCENSLRGGEANAVTPEVTTWKGRLRSSCNGGQDRGSVAGLLRSYPSIELGETIIAPQVVSSAQSFQLGTMATTGVLLSPGKSSQIAIVGGTGSFGGAAGAVDVKGEFGSVLTMRGSFRR